MLLHQWYWPCQNVEAGTNQVHEEYFMIFDNTEYTFVVVSSALRTEVYNNSLRRMWFYGTNRLAEAKHIR
jgi:hypothetical protein